MIEKEIWKDIPNYEGLYQVSNYGKVKSFLSNKILTPRISRFSSIQYHLKGKLDNAGGYHWQRL